VRAAHDWQRVRAAGATFAVAQATLTPATADPFGRSRWRAMAAAGLVRGACCISWAR
jgi:GH25 family lysozyme M1 (1,4-beta-N-acetylmuramidase)